jgi:radical SAM superfamily enzyme YgiQ (UPF0313 family)
MKNTHTFPAGSGLDRGDHRLEGQLPIRDEDILAEKKNITPQSRHSLAGTKKIRVAFCQHWWYEYIGVMMLSAALKEEGHEVECFIHNLSELIPAIERGEFDLVCFTLMTSDVGWAQDNLKKIKNCANPTVPILCGGAHPTYHQHFIQDQNVDMLCIGEGDHTIIEVADAIANGKSMKNIDGLVTKDDDGSVITNPLRSVITDLDSLPYPDRTIYSSKYRYFKGYPIMSMVATRGCPYKCSFCEIPSYMEMYNTKKFYYRSPENILGEIEAAKRSANPPKLIIFVDSTFNLNKKWTLNFLEKYKNVGVKFSCNFTAGTINQATVDALADTKLCHSIRFGVEVGNEEMRRNILNKNVRNKHLVFASDALRAKGIPFYVTIMFGLPSDSVERTMETIELTRRLKPDFVYPTIFMPYRGLSITDMALKTGYLTEQDLEKLDDPKNKRLGSVMRIPDLNQIINLHRFSISLIRHPWTAPFLLKLATFKNNPLFNAFFMCCFFVQTRRWTNLGLKRSIIEGYYHVVEQ